MPRSNDPAPAGAIFCCFSALDIEEQKRGEERDAVFFLKMTCNFSFFVNLVQIVFAF